tara:strand:- start:3469 stop:3657 length:189 start_codon:yes stop_codon:yes gene_type:complete
VTLDLTTEQWIEYLDRLAEIATTEHGSPFHFVLRSPAPDAFAAVNASTLFALLKGCPKAICL